jgi:hypothetical protein
MAATPADHPGPSPATGEFLLVPPREKFVLVNDYYPCSCSYTQLGEQEDVDLNHLPGNEITVSSHSSSLSH